MEALPSSGHVQTLPGPKDRVPALGHLVMIEVECIIDGYVVDSHRLSRGKCSFAVTPERAEYISKKMVADDSAEIETAKRNYERSLDRLVNNELRWIPVEDIRAFRNGEEDHGLDEANQQKVKDRVAYYRQAEGHSWQAEFYAAMDRGPKPFQSMKIVDKRVDYLENVQKAESDQRQVDAMAQGLAQAIKGKKG